MGRKRCERAGSVAWLAVLKSIMHNPSILFAENGDALWIAAIDLSRIRRFIEILVEFLPSLTAYIGA